MHLLSNLNSLHIIILIDYHFLFIITPLGKPFLWENHFMYVERQNERGPLICLLVLCFMELV